MIDFKKVASECVGRWPGILENLGISVGTGKHQFCPICSPGDTKSDRFRFDNKDGAGTYICGQCGAGTGITLVMKTLNIEYKEAMESLSKIVGTVDETPNQKERPVSPEMLRKMFIESHQVKKGDWVSEYLKKRGLSSMPQMLRCSYKVWEPETMKEQIAMLAVFSDNEGQAVTLHRTYLDKNANKLNIDKPKKVMPPLKKMTGGAVRLYDLSGDTLGVTEGIETGIAVHESFQLPVWACLSTSLMEGFVPPSGVKNIIIFGDADRNFAGQKSSYILANKLYLKHKLQVTVELPERIGEDWLDERVRLSNIK